MRDVFKPAARGFRGEKTDKPSLNGPARNTDRSCAAKRVLRQDTLQIRAKPVLFAGNTNGEQESQVASALLLYGKPVQIIMRKEGSVDKIVYYFTANKKEISMELDRKNPQDNTKNRTRAC